MAPYILNHIENFINEFRSLQIVRNIQYPYYKFALRLNLSKQARSALWLAGSNKLTNQSPERFRFDYFNLNVKQTRTKVQITTSLYQPLKRESYYIKIVLCV